MQFWTPKQSLKNGRFVVQKVLGNGGFGVTYSVLEQKTNKLFAIKTLNPMQQSQDDFAEKQEQFVNEALRLRGCQHPHIVKVHEVIQEDGLWGMVMEYIQGDDLGVYVDKHGQLSESEALRYINQVGQALEYVHQQGFLHRDIKPSNIILRSGKQEAQKEVLLIDFGLAREFTIGKTLSMTNSKTEGYAPIEQYERQGRCLGGTEKYDKQIWEAFGDRIGWRNGVIWLKYPTWDTKAPKGHLPVLIDGLFVGWWVVCGIFSRRDL